MDKEFYIIVGRSGSGKGTQAALLKKVLEERGVEHVFHVTTGAGFRELISGSSYTAGIARGITNSGGLNPEFLAIWNWANLFMDNLTGNETVILDGAPRRMAEVAPLHSAIEFYGYTKPTVIYLDVSETWAMDKLASRGREDDSLIADQKKKMEWFDNDVLPCVDSYSRDPRYSYLHVNGEQSIEDVHAELLLKLNETRH